MNRARASAPPKATLQEDLISNEIRMIVEEAIAAGGTLQTGPHVKRLLTVYGDAGVPAERIANELIKAAASSGVAVEMQSGNS